MGVPEKLEHRHLDHSTSPFVHIWLSAPSLLVQTFLIDDIHKKPEHIQSLDIYMCQWTTDNLLVANKITAGDSSTDSFCWNWYRRTAEWPLGGMVSVQQCTRNSCIVMNLHQPNMAAVYSHQQIRSTSSTCGMMHRNPFNYCIPKSKQC